MTMCPNGHASATADYCDQCGARIPAAADDPDTAAATVPDPCPDCGLPRAPADRFCEGCGYDFTQRAATWEAVIRADRQRFERYPNAGLSFPAQDGERCFALNGDEVTIGRLQAGGSGASPQIGLGDPAVSQLHAAFVRQRTGAYSIVDLSSTNGTTINDDPKPIDARTPVPLREGDRVGVGAWTTITVRRRARGQKSSVETTPAASTFIAS